MIDIGKYGVRDKRNDRERREAEIKKELFSLSIELTVPQMSAALSTQKKKYFEWGRGSGKSFILAFFMKEMVMQMPRASFALVGVTYSQILSRTLPSTKEGLESLNIFEDVDYVVGRCGKSLGFAMPFQRPNSWKNIIHFSNGAIFQLVSLDLPDSGRGLNAYGIIADEAALLDPVKLYNNVKTTNRAKKKVFENCPLLGAEIYASSTPLNKKGKWFTDMEKTAKDNPELYYFSRSNAFWNPNIRKEWFEEMRLESPSQLIYEAEILNIRPKEITDGFYANLNPAIHYYTDYNNEYLDSLGLKVRKEHFNCLQDNDVRVREPLQVSLDFGVFNGAVVSQEYDGNENILKSFYVKSPKLLTDLFIEQIIPYYAPHQEKKIYLYGGHDGNNRMPNSSKTLYEEVEEVLREHGWKVYLMAKGSAPSHHDRYLLINAMLKGHPKLPGIRINEHNNQDLIIALEHAEAVEKPEGVGKNKSAERNKSIRQEHATHLTDAFDAPLASKYLHLLGRRKSLVGEFRIQSN
jgi:hypothetical protein